MIRIRRKLLGYVLSGIVLLLYVTVLYKKINNGSDEEDYPIKCFQGVEDLTQFEVSIESILLITRIFFLPDSFINLRHFVCLLITIKGIGR